MIMIKGTTAKRWTVGMPKTNDAPPHSHGFLPLALANRDVQTDTSAKAAIRKTVLIMLLYIFRAVYSRPCRMLSRFQPNI